MEQGTRQGSSPHVRGAQVIESGAERFGGIIPACAGSTSRPKINHGAAEDHPRMCGEHAAMTLDVYADLGSSPHVRGAPDDPPL